MEDVCEYKLQISEIDAKLATCTDLSMRNELLEMKHDLEELIALVTEEANKGEATDLGVGEVSGLQQNPSTSSPAPVVDEYGLTDEEVIGMHCRAPYSHQVDRAVHFHDAVIFDIVHRDADPEALKVTVLYCYPLEEKMRPCEYFLNDRCHYGDKCRYSHGQTVLFSDLMEYTPPDFTDVKEGKLVLARNERMLWSSARIVAIDGNKIAAKLLSTGKEMSCEFSDIIPLQEDINEGSNDTIEQQQISWPELKGERNGNVKVGDLGDWERHTRGIGMKLLMKMGYKVGEGLGRDSNGIVHAIQPVLYPKSKFSDKSLDVCMERKRSVVDGVEQKKKRVKKELAEKFLKKPVKLDMFDVLNEKLACHVPVKVDTQRNERKRLKETSSRQLNIHALDLERQMKDLKAKERKLQEGIVRNSRDQATVGNLKKALQKCQADIRDLQGKQDLLSTEVVERKKRKDIF